MKKTIAAYVMDHSAEGLRVQDLIHLDILYYAFSTLRDGKPGLYGLKNPELMSRVRALNPSLKVVLSIGGWEAGGFSEAAMTPEGRAIFTQAAMDCIRAHDFDGIDMDWEYPCSSASGIASHPDDKYHFTELLADLRHALDTHGRAAGKPMHLSAAVGAGASCIAGMEADKVGQILDQVNLMTYDMRIGGIGPAGHHTGLYPQTGFEEGMCGDKSVTLYAQAGVPLSKMVLGAAFYGRSWLHTAGLNHPAEKGSSLRYTDIDRLLASETGYTRHWDEQAHAPYLYNGLDFISYDDEESLTDKCAYVEEKGLSGIMFWEYGGDKTGKLLNTMFKALGRRSE